MLFQSTCTCSTGTSKIEVQKRFKVLKLVLSIYKVLKLFTKYYRCLGTYEMYFDVPGNLKMRNSMYYKYRGVPKKQPLWHLDKYRVGQPLLDARGGFTSKLNLGGPI